MANYLIHAVPRRMWYVNDFLIPSMLEQGIDRDNIRIYNDEKQEGNLRACMNAFDSCHGDGGTWHLQDDVCICNEFKTITEAVDFGLVCGFSSELYDGPGKIGLVDRKDMWFSFPCIRIPNDYARDCAEWVTKYIIGNPVYRDFWEKGVNDDWAFRLYLKEFYTYAHAMNIAPNLVDHVDFLVGGGTGAKPREKPVRAQYWKDNSIIEKLAEKIANRT